MTDTFTGGWVKAVSVNGQGLICSNHPGCSDWYVDTEGSQGHCRCHETEFFVGGTGQVVVVRLGSSPSAAVGSPDDA